MTPSEIIKEELYYRSEEHYTREDIRAFSIRILESVEDCVSRLHRGADTLDVQNFIIQEIEKVK